MKCAGFVVNTSVSSAYWSVLVKYCLRGKNDKGATALGMGPIVTIRAENAQAVSTSNPTPQSLNLEQFVQIRAKL